MKILHLIRGVDPKSGGPPYVLRHITRGLIDRGHEVSILTSQYQPPLTRVPCEEYLAKMKADPAFEGAELMMARYWGGGRLLERYCYTPEARTWLKRRLADPDLRPDIIHVHELFCHLLGIGPVFARKWGIPYGFSPHGSLDKMCYESGHAAVKRLFSRLFLKKNLQHASFIHVSSEHEFSQIDHVGDWFSADCVKQIPFGVELPEFDVEESNAAFAEAFPPLCGRRFVFHLARLHPIKRCELLIRTLPLLPESMADVMLFVGGNDYGHKEALVEAAERAGVLDRVVFAGFISGKAKQGAFQSASAFGLTSQHENHGVVVLEALANGLPAVVTPEVASHVHVDATGCGCTVEADPASIADGIARVITDVDDSCRVGAKNFVRNQLSWEPTLDRIAAMYENVLNASRGQ